MTEFTFAEKPVQKSVIFKDSSCQVDDHKISTMTIDNNKVYNLIISQPFGAENSGLKMVGKDLYFSMYDQNHSQSKLNKKHTKKVTRKIDKVPENKKLDIAAPRESFFANFLRKRPNAVENLKGSDIFSKAKKPSIRADLRMCKNDAIIAPKEKEAPHQADGVLNRSDDEKTSEEAERFLVAKSPILAPSKSMFGHFEGSLRDSALLSVKESVVKPMDPRPSFNNISDTQVNANHLFSPQRNSLIFDNKIESTPTPVQLFGKPLSTNIQDNTVTPKLANNTELAQTSIKEVKMEILDTKDPLDKYRACNNNKDIANHSFTFALLSPKSLKNHNEDLNETEKVTLVDKNLNGSLILLDTHPEEKLAHKLSFGDASEPWDKNPSDIVGKNDENDVLKPIETNNPFQPIVSTPKSMLNTDQQLFSIETKIRGKDENVQLNLFAHSNCNITPDKQLEEANLTSELPDKKDLDKIFLTFSNLNAKADTKRPTLFSFSLEPKESSSLEGNNVVLAKPSGLFGNVLNVNAGQNNIFSNANTSTAFDNAIVRNGPLVPSLFNNGTQDITKESSGPLPKDDNASAADKEDSNQSDFIILEE